jgi:hypothetical protein
VRFQIFTAVRMMIYFWVLAPCKFVGRCQCFSKILSSTNKPTWHQNLEEEHHQVTKCMYSVTFLVCLPEFEL